MFRTDLAQWLGLVLGMAALGACARDHGGAHRAAAGSGAVAESAGHGAPDAGSPHLGGSATVMLEPTDVLAAMGDSPALTGVGTFTDTGVGVDLVVSLRDCDASKVAYPAYIQQGTDCSADTLLGAHWDSPRGEGIGAIGCTGLTGVSRTYYYSRPASDKKPWTIGNPSASDVLDHALVLYDPITLQPVACGQIVRADDVALARPSSADAGVPMMIRAQLAGLCLGKLFVRDNAQQCPNPDEVVQCATTHCELEACVATCNDYIACLKSDPTGDTCSAAFTCSADEACSTCQSQVSSCLLGFCPDLVACAAPITPDGPCSRLEACCAMQGDAAASCLEGVHAIEKASGDPSCAGAMLKLGNHCAPSGAVQVPVMSGSRSMSGTFVARSFIAWSLCACLWNGCAEGRKQLLQPDGAVEIVTLPDDMAGKGCKHDSDCANGRCATTLHIISADDAVTAPGGYCTAGCSTDSSCGLHGACSVPAAESGGECLASCQSNDDCRAGYLCADAARVGGVWLAGTCQPKPATDTLADGVTGQACEFDADCGGGQCAAVAPLGTVYPGNYCTGHCFADADCGSGGACLVLAGGSEAGRCFEHCDTDSDCTRDGYRCWPLSPGFNACYPAPPTLPEQVVGSACASDADCAGIPGACAASLPFGNFFEYKVVAAPGGYCTLPCSLDALCGSGGQCISSGAAGGTCLSRCTTVSDCRDGYTCFAHERALNEDDKVCIPLSSP